MRGCKWSAVIVALLFLTGVVWALKVPSAGRVNCSALNVRTGPGMNYSVVTVIYQGEPVTIIDVAGKWYQINFQGSSDRYVWAGYIDVTSYTDVSDDDSARKPTPTLKETDPKRQESSNTDTRSLSRNDF